MGMTVQASDGTMIPIDSVAKSYAYTVNNNTSITVNYAGNTYVQTMTYDGSNNLLTRSIWQLSITLDNLVNYNGYQVITYQNIPVVATPA